MKDGSFKSEGSETEACEFKECEISPTVQCVGQKSWYEKRRIGSQSILESAIVFKNSVRNYKEWENILIQKNLLGNI